MIIGLNMTNLRYILSLIIYGEEHMNGIKNGTFEKLKYIIPLQYQFKSPLENNGFDTYCLYYIERDKTLTADGYTKVNDKFYDKNMNTAYILLRFCGGNAEQMAKLFRHQAKRDETWNYWRIIANAEKLDYVGDIMPRNVFYFGEDTETAFDIRFRVLYNELIDTGWEKMKGLSVNFNGILNTKKTKEFKDGKS